MALVLSGKDYAREVRKSVKERAAGLQGPPPGLAVIMVGDDPASSVYVASKERACRKAGFLSRVIRLDESSTEDQVLGRVHELNRDDSIHGILVQLPVPEHISPDAVAAAVDPAKDVDGFHPVNVGRLWRGEKGLFPCTPMGIMGLLKRHDIPLEGKNALVLGRSNIVGKPMAALLLRENCTVTIAHSRTVNLPAMCSRADILIAAVGRPRMIGPDLVSEGAVVIDVGMNRDENGDLCGDVDYQAVFGKASAITPVPGGVGPLTIAFLLENTLRARTGGFAD